MSEAQKWVHDGHGNINVAGPKFIRLAQVGDPERAELIVRAVNTHPDLVAELKGFVSNPWLHTAECPAWDDSTQNCNCKFGRARALIAKAEGMS